VVTSIIVGTSGLTVIALAAFVLTFSRRPVSRVDLEKVRVYAALAVLAHIGHFCEEYYTGFYQRFPDLLGLAPWSPAFFVSFNLGWVGIWLLCILVLHRFPRIAVFPIWFLGIASAANGLLHPAIALAVGGYFPGLWSSPAAGILGVMLLRKVAFATRPEQDFGEAA
jgi:hypothetical protein